jgi:hypothetical protein
MYAQMKTVFLFVIISRMSCRGYSYMHQLETKAVGMS